MSKDVYLCEKPLQAEDLARVLGITKKNKGYFEGDRQIITWFQGNVLELASPVNYDASLGLWNLDQLPILPDKWIKKVSEKTKYQYNIVKTLIAKASHVIIATDADRAGEVIAREVLEFVGYKKRISRLWTSALDDTSLRTALNNLKDSKSTESLYHAGIARMRADWLVGINLTRAYSCKITGTDTYSAGRVQTQALALVVTRDAEIDAFVPRDYFDVTADFKTTTGTWSAKWLVPDEQNAIIDNEDEFEDDEESMARKSKTLPRCWDRATAKKVLDAITKKPGKIAKSEMQRKELDAPLPFDMSSLQKYASAKWGYSLNETLAAAQSLYSTHKVTSYPRVECRFLPSSQFNDASAIMAALSVADENLMKLVANADITRKSTVWNDKAIKDNVEAHHGIIPTAVTADLSAMTPKERNIYDIICKYYIAQFYPPYIYDSSVIDTDVTGFIFRCSGVTPVNYGWKIVLGDVLKVNKPIVLPLVVMGDSALCMGAKIVTEKTTPPPRYTQGTLVDDMKNIHRIVDDPVAKAMLKKTRGIGTPATRDSIIDNLFDKFYLEGKKQVISTKKGKEFISIVTDTTPELIDPIMTGKWELAFERIASGALNEEMFTKTIKGWVTKLVNDIKSTSINVSEPDPGPPCPICKGGTVTRKGKNGLFYGCLAYPKCKGVVNIPNQSPRKRRLSKPKKEASSA